MLCERGLVGSMARRGNPYDNAMMEKWNGRLPPQMWKVERAEVDPHEPMASMCPEGKCKFLADLTAKTPTVPGLQFTSTCAFM